MLHGNRVDFNAKPCDPGCDALVYSDEIWGILCGKVNCGGEGGALLCLQARRLVLIEEFPVLQIQSGGCRIRVRVTAASRPPAIHHAMSNTILAMFKRLSNLILAMFKRLSNPILAMFKRLSYRFVDQSFQCHTSNRRKRTRRRR
jgi:hypothetical protein